MNYDDWIVEQEHNFRGWNDYNYDCPECGKPVKQEDFCSGDCFEASML